MRLTLAAIALVAFPVALFGQPTPVAGAHESRFGPLGPGLVAPLPPNGLPLPQLGLPLPTLGLSPPNLLRPSAGHLPRSRRDLNGHRRGGLGSAVIAPLTFVYVAPVFLVGNANPDVGGVPSSPVDAAATLDVSSAGRGRRSDTGTLRLDVEPRRALQLFVDGYYVGTDDDVSGELELRAGRHGIEIRSPEHETLRFDVEIRARDSITYRGELKPSDAAPAASAPPDALRKPTTFYVIPGCYAGDVPPQDVPLPAGCDRAAVRTFQR